MQTLFFCFRSNISMKRNKKKIVVINSQTKRNKNRAATKDLRFVHVEFHCLSPANTDIHQYKCVPIYVYKCIFNTQVEIDLKC